MPSPNHTPPTAVPYATHLPALVEALPDPVWLKDREGVYLACNSAFRRLLGVAPEGVVGKTDHQLLAREVAEAWRARDREALAAGQSSVSEECLGFVAEGKRAQFEILRTPLRDATGAWIGVLASAREITHRLADAATDVMAVAFESQEGRVVTDADRVILRVNQAFSRITGYSAQEVIGKKPDELTSGPHDAAFFAAVNERLEQTGVWQGEIWNRHKSGEVFPQWLAITAVKSPEGRLTHYLGTMTDISERKSIENELRNLAFYDPLTRLPNRRLLLDRLQQAMAASARSGRSGALMLLDLDNFKALNDSLGHDMGDELLTKVARRLESSVRQGDTVARMGGDEFVVMLEGLDADGMAAAQAESVAAKIRAALNRTHSLTRHHSLATKSAQHAAIEYRCTSSIGIALFLGHQDSVAALLKKADLAMYQSKATGRNAVSFFDRGIQDAFSARISLHAEIEEAIRNRQFVIHYHPLADGSGGGVSEVEALIRWQHPRRGLLHPAEFIQLAEQTRQIIALDHWVLTTACAQLAAWAHSPNRAHLCVTVNVSPLTFSQQDFAKLVLKDLRKSGADPHRLRLEFTERLVLDDVGNIIAKMATLSDTGVSFSLDDFGTGDSSLTYLKRLPLHQLKISRSLVHDMNTSADAASLVYTVIALAKCMGLTVVAKGAETAEQQTLLSAQHCDLQQSHLFCEPMPLSEFEGLLDQHQDLLARDGTVGEQNS